MRVNVKAGAEARRKQDSSKERVGMKGAGVKIKARLVSEWELHHRGVWGIVSLQENSSDLFWAHNVPPSQILPVAGVWLFPGLFWMSLSAGGKNFRKVVSGSPQGLTPGGGGRVWIREPRPLFWSSPFALPLGSALPSPVGAVFWMP